jgi:hypothetical protein
MATITVDQQRLVLNSFAAIFQNNLVSKDLVTWRKFDGEMNDRNGLAVVEQVTPDYTTTVTTSGVNDLSAGVQDTTFGSEQYKLTQVIGSSMGWGDFVKIRDIGAARESEALKKAALRLATDIDAYIIGYAAKASNNWVGNANGTNDIATFTDMASALTRLKKEGVEDDVRAVLSYDDWQALGANIVNSNASLPDIGSGTYRSGFSGTVAGVSTMFTQQLQPLVVGSRVASGVTLTNQPTTPAVTYASVAISGAAGNYMTSTINLDGQTGSVTLKDGEVFTIAGVYAYDPRAKKQLAHLQQFRVIGDYTATAGAFANVRIFPAIIVTGPQQTVVNTNADFDNRAVTHIGVASTATMPRFLANKSAIVVNTADLIMPATGTASRKALTQVPVSVRMWQDSVFATGEHRIRFDVALEANVMADGRRRIVRLNGA